jgi:hypothetical protein
MARRKDCLDEIADATKGRLSREDITDRLSQIEGLAEQDSKYGESPRESYRRAAEQMMKDASVKSDILKRNIRMDALKARDRRQYLEAAPSPRVGIEARLVGVHKPFFDPKSRLGNQSSVGAQALGTMKEWIGGVVVDLEKQGLDKVFFSRAIEKDWARERYELSLGERGNPGVTKNDQALKIAETLKKWDNVRIEALNGEGAWIQNYAGYVARTEHDPNKLRKASNNGFFRKGFEDADRDAWVADAMQRLDLRRTFGGRDPKKILEEMYGGLIDGTHGNDVTVPVYNQFGSTARKVSQSRELHFKSADDWLAYNEKYGRFSPTDAMLYSLQIGAKRLALMKAFGSKPREGFADMMAQATNMVRGTKKGDDLAKWQNALENRFKVVSGEADIPVASTWSGILDGWMSIQRMAKLGLTPFSMIADNATISAELGRQGLSFLENKSGLLSGYFRGAKGSQKREIAQYMHTGILNRIRGNAARFDVADSIPGRMAWLEHQFFKRSGMTAMTENKRADAEHLMAWHMGRQRGKDFSKLGKAETDVLQAFGIGDKEWQLLHKVEWNKTSDGTYLTPDIVAKIPDEDVVAYLKDRDLISPNPDLRPMTSPERAKRDLALKLWSYYTERGQSAVIETGAKEKAIIYQGTQAGTPLNSAIRMIAQFKQFPTAMVTKAWGAEINGGKSTMGKVAGIAELAVASTIYGALGLYLNDLAKGQDPHARWKAGWKTGLASSFVKGGSGSIYGDFVAGEWSRHGLSALDTAAGPTLGQANKLLELWSSITHGKGMKEIGGSAVRLARSNIPLMNMIYTKLAFDHLVYYRLLEYFNPGYLQRMEQTLKDKQGTEFWLKPSSTSR